MINKNTLTSNGWAVTTSGCSKKSVFTDVRRGTRSVVAGTSSRSRGRLEQGCGRGRLGQGRGRGRRCGRAAGSRRRQGLGFAVRSCVAGSLSRGRGATFGAVRSRGRVRRDGGGGAVRRSGWLDRAAGFRVRGPVVRGDKCLISVIFHIKI